MFHQKTFHDVEQKDGQFKKLAIVSAIIFLAVITILILEIVGIRP
jgi:hypothetical protein